MPLASVQHHVQSVIDGLAVPGVTDSLSCYITPPVLEGLNGPRAYVWGGRTVERRQTAPRGAGFKTLTWTVDVYLAYESPSNTGGADDDFPTLVDGVMGALRGAPMPVQITDGRTGVVSQIVAIGEDMDLDYPPEHTAAALRILYWASRIGVTVIEAVQG